MAKDRCNCDASCGENRYHDFGGPECMYRNVEEVKYLDKTRPGTTPVPAISTAEQNAAIKILRIIDDSHGDLDYAKFLIKKYAGLTLT